MKRSAVHLTLAGSLVLGTLAATTSVTQARTVTVNEHINNDRCYEARRIPALVEYNTRGRLVATSSRELVGDMKEENARIVDRHNDAVYVMTREVVEDQHVTLIPVEC
ncbi:MAG: hypothetical protein ACFB01_12885 [Cohaesibacteraceae bacterium]